MKSSSQDKTKNSVICGCCHRKYLRMEIHLERNWDCKQYIDRMQSLVNSNTSDYTSTRNSSRLNSNQDVDESSKHTKKGTRSSMRLNSIETNINSLLCSEETEDIPYSQSQHVHKSLSHNTGRNLSNLPHEYNLDNLDNQYLHNDTIDFEVNEDNLSEEESHTDLFPTISVENSTTNNHNKNHNHILDKNDFTQSSQTLLNNQNSTTFTLPQLLSIKLFEILNKTNAPIGLYDEMKKFIESAYPKLKKIGDPSLLLSRSLLVKNMHSLIFSRDNQRKTIHPKKRPIGNSNIYQEIGQKGDTSILTLHHTNLNIQLHETKHKVTIPVFDFVSQVTSRLLDPMLMKASHLLINKPEYTNPSKYPSIFYDDIESSKWFNDTHKKLIKDADNELLCPIILFIDGVAIDTYGRISLEPVLFTLGIFKRSIRHLESCWRVLGFAPNPEKSNNIVYRDYKSGPDLKKYHYHQIMKAILDQINNVQINGGIKWTFKYTSFTSTNNQSFPSDRTYTLKFPVIFVIGDCVGNDKLCSRKQVYRPTNTFDTGVCRDCNITYQHCHNHKYQCNYMSRNVVKNMGNLERNKANFYDVGINCFDHISFGGDNLGINGSSPPEPLHQWYLGVVSFMIEYFLSHMTIKAKDYLNVTVRSLAVSHGRQSERNIPNINPFVVGLEKLKLTGMEKGAQLFVLYISLMSQKVKENLVMLENDAPRRYTTSKQINSDGTTSIKKNYFSKILDTNQSYNAWLRMFERMLIFSEWMSGTSTRIRKDSFDLTETMDLYVAENVHVSDEICSNELGVEEVDDSMISTREEIDNLFFVAHDQFTPMDVDTEAIKYTKNSVLISIVEKNIREMMFEIKKLISRDDHKRLMTVKFHQLIHMVMYIMKYGSPSNFNGCTPERMVKDKAKRPGSHTQKRTSTINSQTCNRVMESQVVGQAMSIAYETGQFASNNSNGWPVYFIQNHLDSTYNAMEKDNEDTDDTVGTDCEKIVSVRGSFRFKYNIEQVHQRSFHPLKLTNINVSCSDEDILKHTSENEQAYRMKVIVQTIYSHMFEYILVEKLTCFDSGSIIVIKSISFSNNTQFHATFEYYNNKSWFDWCNIRWYDDDKEIYYVLPAKIVAIISGDSIQEQLKEAVTDPSAFPSGSIWMIVISASCKDRNNSFISKIASLYKLENNYSLVSIDDIVGSCFAFEDRDYNDQAMDSTIDNVFCNNYIVVEQRSKWGHKFCD